MSGQVRSELQEFEIPKIEFSVIMAAHNAERTIRSAIRSALLAGGAGIEVLVFLDGCTDKTKFILDSFIQDKRIRVFESDVKIGRVKARNHLVNHARGLYISILDADDIALPWRFFCSRRLLRKYDAVFSPAIVFGRQLRPIPVIPQVFRRILPNDMPVNLLARNPLVHSSASFRVELARRSESLYPDSETEEYVLWLRFVNQGFKLFRSRIPWVMYRYHASQVSQTPGFMTRVGECSLLLAERLKLARRLYPQESILANSLGKSIHDVQKHGFLARLEILGISGFRAKVRRD